jgi:hypothetical protein
MRAKFSCVFCRLEFLNNNSYKTHLRKFHSEEATEQGLIGTRPRKSRTDQKRKAIDEPNTLKSSNFPFDDYNFQDGQLDDVIRASLSSNETITHQMQEVKELKTAFSDIDNCNAFTILMASIDGLTRSGMNEEETKRITCNTISNLMTTDPTLLHQIKQVFEPKYQQIVLKNEGFITALNTKKEQINNIASYTQSHLDLDARVKGLTEEQIDKELVFAEYYYPQLIYLKSFGGKKHLHMKLLKDCFNQLGL